MTILEHSALPVGLPRWILEDRRLRIGSVGGAESRAFGELVGVIAIADSVIVAADAQARELRAFSTGDEHLWSFGRPGDGPQEFGSISSIWAVGDTIVAVDRGRLSVVDGDGTFIRSVDIQRLDSVYDAASTRNLGVVGPPRVEAGTHQGLLVAAYNIAGGARPDGRYRSSRHYALVSTDGEYIAPLGNLGGPESAQITTRGITPDGAPFDATVHTELPIGRRTIVAAGANGIAIGDQSRLVVHYYDSKGALTKILRVESPPQLLDRERFAASRGDSCTGGACWQLESLPDTLPAFGGLLLDPDGNLWVEEFVPDYEDRLPEWSIFDAEGYAVATAVMPAGFVPHQADRNWLLGMVTDDLGVQYVELWSIEGSMPEED